MLACLFGCLVYVWWYCTNINARHPPPPKGFLFFFVQTLGTHTTVSYELNRLACLWNFLMYLCWFFFEIWMDGCASLPLGNLPLGGLLHPHDLVAVEQAKRVEGLLHLLFVCCFRCQPIFFMYVRGEERRGRMWWWWRGGGQYREIIS